MVIIYLKYIIGWFVFGYEYFHLTATCLLLKRIIHPQNKTCMPLQCGIIFFLSWNRKRDLRLNVLILAFEITIHFSVEKLPKEIRSKISCVFQKK